MAYYTRSRQAVAANSFSDTMSPWKQGRKRVLDEKPVLKYFQRDSDNDYWICKVLLDEDDGDEDDGDEEHCCEAKIKGMGSDSNLGNSA